MITIEEKLKLFTKLVYDRVEKENESTIKEFNELYGNLIEKKKEEFQKKAQEILNRNIKDIDREKIKILSKARVEEKKIILEKRKAIFEEAVKKILDYAKKFTDEDEYGKLLLKDVSSVSKQLEGKNIDIYLMAEDNFRFKEKIDEAFEGRIVDYIVDDELIGGFIAFDRDKNVRIDMSMITKVKDSSELIGNKLYRILQ